MSASGLWSQWHKPLSHRPQIAEHTLPRLAPRFSKMWKCPQYSKKVIAWHGCGLSACIIPHWMQGLVFKTLAFAVQSNQWVKELSLIGFLNWDKCAKYIKW